MKQPVASLFVGILLLGLLGAPTIAYGDQPDNSQQANPCNIGVPGGGIPDSFSVKDCLTAPGQEDSQFIPEKDERVDAQGQVLKNPHNVITFLQTAISLFSKIIASIALIVFIIGALLAITSEGKEDRLEKGKTAMVYAIIGLLVAFFSFVIITLVQSLFF